ncbi:putative MO25-like protein [Hordeum vulgare]|nr:putative MO25-like protein [Hordeum vulgare]
MQRKQPWSISTANLPSVRNLFDEMPIPTPMANDPNYNTFMENTIYEVRGKAFQPDDQGQGFNSDETERQDDRDQDGADHYGVHEEEEANDHGNSWHEDEDMYGEDEEEVVDIVEEPLFIDELT